jgi:hypothetical protein
MRAVLTGLEEVADFQIIREWEKTTEFGDRAEIKTLPESSHAWAKMDARSDLCTGQKCKQFERCFITLMHQRAQESDIIIVNHHLFFADLALKDENDTKAAFCPNITRWCSTKRTKSKTWPGSISAFRQQLPLPGTAARHRRGGRAKKFGTAELDRILDRLEELTGHHLFRCCRRRRRPRRVSPAARISRSATKRSTATCWPRWN